jgi:hypothetical protein
MPESTEDTKGRIHDSQKAKPGGLARLFSFLTFWGLTWF